MSIVLDSTYAAHADCQVAALQYQHLLAPPRRRLATVTQETKSLIDREQAHEIPEYFDILSYHMYTYMYIYIDVCT